MRKIGLVILVVSVLIVAGVASAGKPSNKPVVTIPETAKEVAPGVFYLGTVFDKGRIVEGYAFIDYKKGFGKPGTECGNDICEPGENANKCPQDCTNGGEPDTSSCYSFLARGAKWKTIENWIVNPSNAEGLTSSFILDNLSADIGKWETAAGTEILGTGTVTTSILVADTQSPDDQNEVYFADIDSTGAIGVTIVWGIFSGPPWARELVEWDQIYDDTDFNWSADCLSEICTSKMDFENIATHELGHSVGMGDLYEDRCSEQTMYGYAGYGETKKRTLEVGDIKGVQELYK